MRRRVKTGKGAFGAGVKTGKGRRTAQMGSASLRCFAADSYGNLL